jgi:ABC-type branched-subunit amino acid transport system substrate-binding protein
VGPVRLIALSTVLVAACGSKQPAPAPDWSAEHARKPDAPRAVPALDAGEARRQLAAAIDAGDAGRQVVLANRLVAAGGEPTADEDRAVRTAVDRLRADQLGEVWDQLDPVYPAPLVAFRRALVAEHTADNDAALAWLERATGEPSIRDRVAALRAELEARAAVDPAVVAVLLPLSGPYGRIGSELRDAIELAAGAGGRGAKLVYVDTEGDAGKAVAGVDAAVTEHRAAVILGPVGARESAAAAARAAELGIPIALLSPEHAGAAPDVGVFRLWSSAAWEAAEAVRFAAGEGYDKLAILAPRDGQGGRQIAAFRDAARRAGVSVVAAGQYDPTATDLEPDLKAFLGLDPRTNRRLARHLRKYGRKRGWKTFSPDVEFDLLFLPDDYRRAALVAAFLPYFNVELRSHDVIDIVYLKKKHGGRVPQVVQLLGSSGWHHPALIPRGGQLLEGAMLIDVFAGGADEAYATDTGAGFAADFQRRFGRPPGAVAAQAHDAALLVFAARARAAAAGADVRPRMVRELLRSRIDDGACGPAAVAASGEVIRDAIVLRIDGGQFAVYDR